MGSFKIDDIKKLSQFCRSNAISQYLSSNMCTSAEPQHIQKHEMQFMYMYRQNYGMQYYVQYVVCSVAGWPSVSCNRPCVISGSTRMFNPYYNILVTTFCALTLYFFTSQERFTT